MLMTSVLKLEKTDQEMVVGGSRHVNSGELVVSLVAEEDVSKVILNSQNLAWSEDVLVLELEWEWEERDSD